MVDFRAMYGSDCRTILYVCNILFKRYPNYLFPLYMLIKYIHVQKSNKKYKIKAVPDEFMNILFKHKIIDNCCDTNNCIVLNKKMLKLVGLRNKSFLKIRYKTNKTIKERIAQIFYTNMDTNYSESVSLSDTLLNNLGIDEVEQYIHLIYVKDPHLKVATEVDISLISVHNGINTAATDDILKRYFETPKILYMNDIIAINIQIYGAEYYYTNKQMNEMPTIYFKCNKIILGQNDNADGACICVSDKTTLKQSADIQSFIPRRLSNLLLVTKEKREDIFEFDDTLIDMCPYGLSLYVNDVEKAIVPFLDNKS